MEQVKSNDKIKRTLIGKVIRANKTPHTIVVAIERHVKHAKYDKYRTHYTKLLVHDEKAISQPGQTVVIKESKPISKRKAWVLESVVG
jgi:small subunit ribosomal protein S17